MGRHHEHSWFPAGWKGRVGQDASVRPLRAAINLRSIIALALVIVDDANGGRASPLARSWIKSRRAGGRPPRSFEHLVGIGILLLLSKLRRPGKTRWIADTPHDIVEPAGPASRPRPVEQVMQIDASLLAQVRARLCCGQEWTAREGSSRAQRCSLTGDEAVLHPSLSSSADCRRQQSLQRRITHSS